MYVDKKKMAVGKSPISVVVVEGEFSALHRFGFPLPALATMQDAGVQLRDASWDIRKSATGLSVSFFWPTSVADQASTLKYSTCMKGKPKRRRRRQRRKMQEVQPSSVPSKVPVELPATSHPLIDAPLKRESQATDVSTEAEPVMTKSCPIESSDVVVIEPEMRTAKKMSLNDSTIEDPQSDVFYHELDSNTPGVCVESGDGKLSWSPIKMTSNCVKAVSDTDSSSDSPDEEFIPSECLSVSFERRFGVPGFEIETSADNDIAVWVPVALRTRSRLKTS